MGLFDILKGELVDIVEWIDDTNGQTVVWRFPRFQNAIKNGAQLIVRPGQVAVLVDEGRMADLFTEGSYTLSTANVPVLSTLRGWKHGFESPFKVEVYFVSTKLVPGLKWGTPNPLMMRDPDFGAIRLGAFGTYMLRCTNPKLLLEQLVGTDGVYDVNEVNDVMRSIIQSSFATVLGKNQRPALDLLASYEALGEEVRVAVAAQVGAYGLEVPQLKVVNVNVPEGVQKALDQRAAMGALGSASLGPAPQLGAYQQLQLANALGQAGGGGRAGIDLGLGVALAGQMLAQQQQQPAFVAGPPGPPPLPVPSLWQFGIGGQNVGPLGLDVARQLVATGQVTPATLAWTTGMTGWAPAGNLPALATLFSAPPPSSSGPPPLPG